MSKLLELAERCEGAEGADRELDAAIWEALALVPESHCKMWCRMDGRTDLTREMFVAAWAPAYSVSLDAALTLGDGAGVLITLSEIKGDGMPLCVIGNPETAALFEAVANTMPLALCAAALRARAGQ